MSTAMTNLGGVTQGGAHNYVQAHAAATNHGNGAAGLDVGGENDRTQDTIPLGDRSVFQSW